MVCVAEVACKRNSLPRPPRHGDAVGDVFGVRLTSWPAWWLWRTVYLLKIPGIGRKLRVMADWTMDLVTRRDYAEIGLYKLHEFLRPDPAADTKAEAEKKHEEQPAPQDLPPEAVEQRATA